MILITRFYTVSLREETLSALYTFDECSLQPGSLAAVCLSHPLTERYGLAVTAFAARRLNVSRIVRVGLKFRRDLNTGTQTETILHNRVKEKWHEIPWENAIRKGRNLGASAVKNRVSAFHNAGTIE